MVINRPDDIGPDPRIELPLRTSSDTEGKVADLLAKLEASGKDLKILRLLANAPGMFRPFVHMADGLLNHSRLPAKERELVILHLAARLGVYYEWAEHIPMSRDAGVNDRERTLLASGSLDDLSMFGDSERMALRSARVIADDELTPALWRSGADVLGEEAMIDLVLTVAWWGAFVPMIINALGLIDPAASGSSDAGALPEL
jgi:4-carboxymuconolactone decarboxylase